MTGRVRAAATVARTLFRRGLEIDMAQWKFTAIRGGAIKDVAISVGTPIAGSDALELNIDQTKMTKAEAVAQLDGIRTRLVASKWPAL